MKKISLLALFSFILFNVEAQKEPIVAIELSVSPTSVNFEASGGQKTLTVNTNASSWSTSGEPAWCSIKKSGNSLIITCNANPGSNERNGSFNVHADNKQVRVTISQKPQKEVITLSVSSTSVNFDATGGQRTLTVSTNAPS